MGRHFEGLFEPEDLGFDRLDPASLKGAQTHQEAAKIVEAVLSGQGSKAQEAVVIVNAAFALLATDQTKGDIFEKLADAREALASGASLRLLRKQQQGEH